jgi:hypothetical protein
MVRKRHSVSLLFAICLAAALCHGQDLTPRAYVITPVHSNAIILTYNFSDGGVLFDNSVPITNATATLDVPSFSYYHSLSFFSGAPRTSPPRYPTVSDTFKANFWTTRLSCSVPACWIHSFDLP